MAERGNRALSPEEIIEEIKKREPEKITCDRILVPTDGSGQAFKAVLQAVRLARATGAELTLLMAIDYNREVAAFEQVSLSGYVPSELKIGAWQFLAQLMHVIPATVAAHPRIEVGDARDVILDVAAEEESELIVMGSRGLDTLSSFFMGSVSRYVVENAKCPVLLVKGMPDDWDEENGFTGGAFEKKK